MPLTQARLKELLEYNPDTGDFIRIYRAAIRINIGDVAGSKDSKGYISIKIDGKSYQAHRLAFLYMTGEMPAEEVDHINHSRADNRWHNLREASHQINGMNQSLGVNNTSGFNGVSFDKNSGKWRSRIRVHGKTKFLGRFDRLSDAVIARRDADEECGYHKNHGSIA